MKQKLEILQGKCEELIPNLHDQSIDILVTSPPYWGQRESIGIGVEADPRDYLSSLVKIFSLFKSKLKTNGIMWINIGDAYNTPINWRNDDHIYSSLGINRAGLTPSNSAYIKPRSKRRAFINKNVSWLQYGNLLGLTYRLVVELCNIGYLFRGEVIWKKRNPMPEGRCRRPHRQHEVIYLFSKSHNHNFQIKPPVGSIWEFCNDKIEGLAHFSRFPEELPKRCIQAYGKLGPEIIVFDPFSGSGTTGIAALNLGCSYIGIEIDPAQVIASQKRILKMQEQQLSLFKD